MLILFFIILLSHFFSYVTVQMKIVFHNLFYFIVSVSHMARYLIFRIERNFVSKKTERSDWIVSVVNFLMKRILKNNVTICQIILFTKSLKFIELARILGGVPVFSLFSLKFKLSSDLAKPIDGSSPILPAGRTSRP